MGLAHGCTADMQNTNFVLDDTEENSIGTLSLAKNELANLRFNGIMYGLPPRVKSFSICDKEAGCLHVFGFLMRIFPSSSHDEICT